ncbi:MAG TPA: exodeoxyribonuclease I [Candidatus Saccharimonadia bacterium]|nr:exodeoxyribonuclease I [Candidatus Saccharimonadia bacterium]
MPQPSLFFYDLETSGLNPRRDRIMQFAGQRTDMELRPIGQPVNLLVALTDEILPSPGAILITGITPQQTGRDGLSEAELARFLHVEVFTPGTIAVGYNNVRFDDVFIRYLNYRNFYDPYEWAWADGRSRWDLLDVMRLARALRPDGLAWPTDADGQPTNRLEHLAAANGLEHTRAHDALSDVEALIALAAKLRQVQPKFFAYLLGLRGKREVARLVDVHQPEPFIYASGRYPKAQLHTTIAYPIASGPNGSVVVYDLRHDPATYAAMPFEELAGSRWPTAEQRAQPDFRPFPAKLLKPGDCPAVAPLATLTPAAETRIGLTQAEAQTHLEALLAGDVVARLREAIAERDFEPDTDVDGRLYDGFFGTGDKAAAAKIRAATPTELATLQPHFTDDRLPELLLRYKARNYPDALTDADRAAWQTYRTDRLRQDWPAFAAAMQQAKVGAATEPARQILADLSAWAQTIAPAELLDIPR